MAKMIGKTVPYGPGGRDCICCGLPRGKQSRKAVRAIKRGKGNSWRKRDDE